MAQQLSLYYFKTAIRKFGAEYVKELIRQLIAADKKATGQLIASLNYELVEASNEILIHIKSVDYMSVVNNGRRPGARMPPVDKIIKWAKVRNIKPIKGKYKTIDQVGWAIAKSIQKKGIKETKVIEKAQQSLLNNKKVVDDLGYAGLLDLNDLVNQIFFDLGSKTPAKVNVGGSSGYR